MEGSKINDKHYRRTFHEFNACSFHCPRNFAMFSGRKLGRKLYLVVESFKVVKRKDYDTTTTYIVYNIVFFISLN